MGGVAAGASTGARLRRLDESAEIVVLERDHYVSFEESRGTQGTAVVKVFDMTAGGTGMTEVELRAAGMDYRKVYTHQNGHAAYYPGTAPLFLKVLFDPTDGKLLGGQVLGWDGVDERIDVLAVALQAGMTIYDLERLTGLHTAIRLGEGSGRHGRLPGREPPARRHRPLVPGGLPGPPTR